MYIGGTRHWRNKTIVAILDENGGILIQGSFPSIVERYGRIWNYRRTGNETSDASD